MALEAGIFSDKMISIKTLNVKLTLVYLPNTVKPVCSPQALTGSLLTQVHYDEKCFGGLKGRSFNTGGLHDCIQN